MERASVIKQGAAVGGGGVVLSVHRLGAGSEGYYLDQVVAGVEDYYAGVGEAPGEWLASSALLGLEGRVDPDDLRAVLLGVDPGRVTGCITGRVVRCRAGI